MPGTLEPTEGTDITDLKEVTNLLISLEPKWHELGIQLNIEKAVLNRIEADHKQDGVKRCLSEMVDHWQNNKDPSWEKLEDAVKKVDCPNDVVRSIRRRYSSSSSSGYEGSPPSGTDSDQDVFSNSSLSPRCGCGECNIHKMCTEGCPRPDYNKPRLHILTKYTGGETAAEVATCCERPTSGCQQISVGTFEKETLELREHYGSLVLDTSRSLQDRAKKSELALYLLSTFPILNKIASEIKQATDMATLFTAVTCQACSWFNIGIIRGLIKKFGNDEDRTRLEAYEQHFERFAKQRLPHGVTHVETGCKAGVTGCKKLVIKVDREWESISIRELERLCIEFATILGAKREDIYLADVTEGCIMLTMMIPKEIVDSLTKTWLTSTQKEMLAKERVVRLTCGKLKWSTSSPASQLSSDNENNEVLTMKAKVEQNTAATSSPTEQTTALFNTSTKSHESHFSASVIQQRAMSKAASTENSFLYRLSKKLTSEESNALVLIQELPARLRDKSAFDVLMQLKMQMRYTQLEELAPILNDIDRNDLAKEVTTFTVKLKQKKNPQDESEWIHQPSATANLDSVLQATKLQFAILNDQTKKLQEAANEARHKRIAEYMQNDLKSASEQLDKKLQYITRLLHSTKMRATRAERRLSSPSSGSIGDGSSSEGSITSLDLEDRKQQVSPDSQEDSDSDSWSSSPRKCATALSVKSRNDFKPQQIKNPAATDGADDADNTGDSGFVEAGEFIKQEPIKEPPAPPSTPDQQTGGYMTLNMATMNTEGHYEIHCKESNTAQETIFSDPRDVLTDDSHP